MADITKELRDILAAVYGRDVRRSIHDAIDKINQVNEVAIGAGTVYADGDPGPTKSDGTPNTNFDQSIYINVDDNEILRCGMVSNVWKWTAIDNIEGNGISSITGPVTDPDDSSGLTDVYTINFTKDATPKTIKVKNALSIVRIDGPTPDPIVPLKQNFTVVFNDTSQNKTFSIYDGKGISAISGPSTSDLIDTYLILYNDGTTDTYQVVNGNRIYQGTAVSGENPSTQVIAPTSGIANARTGDLYNNTAEGSFYHCVIPGDPTTAAWLYDFTISAVATSIDWANVSNKPLGQANGVATLDSNGLVPLAQLPISPEVILPVDPTTPPTTDGAIWITTS